MEAETKLNHSDLEGLCRAAEEESLILEFKTCNELRPEPNQEFQALSRHVLNRLRRT